MKRRIALLLVAIMIAALLVGCGSSQQSAVPAAAVVAEAEVALVLADAYQRAFGYGCMADVLANLETYRKRIAQ